MADVAARSVLFASGLLFAVLFLYCLLFVALHVNLLYEYFVPREIDDVGEDSKSSPVRIELLKGKRLGDEMYVYKVTWMKSRKVRLYKGYGFFWWRYLDGKPAPEWIVFLLTDKYFYG